MNTTPQHTAWRTLGNATAYVEWIGNGQQKGDRYSYTGDVNKAKQMTEKQCRDFCAYMRECATVGFWA
jgi:hypothetical protein